MNLENILKHNLNKINDKFLFELFIWFSCFFYIVVWFYSLTPTFTPFWILISRDIFFLLLIYFFYVKYGFGQIFSIFLDKSKYAIFLRIYIFWFFLNCLYGIIYFLFKDYLDVLQHHFRNILYYSIIIIIIPFIFKKFKDIEEFQKTIINISIIVSFIGIITRIIPVGFYFTWSGRVISTFGDPNNFAIFLCFSMFMLFLYKGYGVWKKIFLFVLFLITFVLANSITAFLVFLFSFSVFSLVKCKWRGIFLSGILFVFILFLTLFVKYFFVWNFSLSYSKIFDIEKYMYDKLFMIVSNKLNCSKKVFDNIYISENLLDKEEGLKTLIRREKQFENFRSNWINLLFGNFKKKRYQKFDNQYLNFLYNFGFLMVILHFSFFIYAIYFGIRCFISDGNHYCLAFASFLFGIVFLGFNGLALQNRFPINFFLYISSALIFRIHELKD